MALVPPRATLLLLTLPVLYYHHPPLLSHLPHLDLPSILIGRLPLSPRVFLPVLCLAQYISCNRWALCPLTKTMQFLTGVSLILADLLVSSGYHLYPESLRAFNHNLLLPQSHASALQMLLHPQFSSFVEASALLASISPTPPRFFSLKASGPGPLIRAWLSQP